MASIFEELAARRGQSGMAKSSTRRLRKTSLRKPKQARSQGISPQEERERSVPS